MEMKTHVSEKDIETYLRDRIKTLGGKAYKLVSPGNDGMPDRMVCLPGEIIFYVETKAPGKTPTPLQRRRHRELRHMGFTVYGKVDSKAKVDRILLFVTGFARPTQQDIKNLEMIDVD